MVTTDAPLMTDTSPASDAPLAPDDCATMEDVRAGVDAIDVELVRLITTRQGYMGAAARIKGHRDDVRVPWRIEQVVENVLAVAKAEGLSPSIAEPVWRELIERSIAYELEAWDALRNDEDARKS